MLNHKHILIEDGPGLGDLVLITPILKKIKNLYPTCTISILTSSKSAPIIERIPYVDKIYTMDRHKFMRQILSFRYLFRQDYVIFTTYQPALAIGSWLLRVPHRAGVCKEKYQKYPFFNCIFPYDVIIRTSQLQIFQKRIAQALQIDLPIEKDFFVSLPTPEEKSSLQQKLSWGKISLTRPFAIVSPYGNTSNGLPDSLIEKTVEYLTAKFHLPCILTDGKNRDFSALIKKFPNEKIINMCGKITLMEMVALFQHATLMVSTDSGPMHISCALKIPTVGVFSSDLPERWAISKYCHVVSIHADCSPCSIDKNTCPYNKKCVNDIPFEMVAKEINTIMAELKKESI